ncbi:MAG: hypothetical protein HPY82_14030 [Gammaproteobacteria bacterium]|nr:hypothetical protein [Gammaproteobacteria bacterium]
MAWHGQQAYTAARFKKLLWVLIGWMVFVPFGSAAYYVPPGTGITLMSLRDGNQIESSAGTQRLDAGESINLAASQFRQSPILNTTRAIALGATVAGADMPPMDHLLGTAFVVPQMRGHHRYELLSPYENTEVRLLQGQNQQAVTLTAGQWTAVNNANNTERLLIQSSTPIVVYHRVIDASGASSDAFAVPPAATALWGLSGKQMLIAAAQNNTNVQVQSSAGDDIALILQAGEQLPIQLSPTSTANQTVAVKLTADKPVMAISLDDTGGKDAVAFWPEYLLASDYRLPGAADYIAIACPQAATKIRWQSAKGAQQVQECGAVGALVGVQRLTGSVLTAGFHFTADHPVLVIAKDTQTRNQYHLTGFLERQYVIGAGTAPLRITSKTDATLVHTESGSQLSGADESSTLSLGSYPAPVWAQEEFVVGGSGADIQNAIDEEWLATDFVLPQARGRHRYWLYSPNASASASVLENNATRTVMLPSGTPVAIDGNSANESTIRIGADRPIAVWHKAEEGSNSRVDAYLAAGAERELWGVQSQDIHIGALRDGTEVDVYNSNGAQEQLRLNAGGYARLSGGNQAAQGQGPGVYLKANYPIAALQTEDGDGQSATVLIDKSRLANRFHLLEAADYVAIVCPDAGTQISVVYPNSDPYTEDCSANGQYPGKLRLPVTAGEAIPAGTRLDASQPVYVMMDPLNDQREHNVYGFKLSGAGATAAPATFKTASFSMAAATLVSAPVITTQSVSTTLNPFTISGTATASTSVRLYINGVLQKTGSSDASGNFTVPAALHDGANSIYVTEWDGVAESSASNSISVTYTNSIPRTQTGTISTSAVWTRGDGTPYQVTGDLVVAAGIELTLMEGARLQFASGKKLTVSGTLTVFGQSGSPAILTSTAASPVANGWVGIEADGTNARVNLDQVEISGATVGIRLKNGAQSTVKFGSLHHNNHGAWVESGSKGNLSNCTIYSNAQHGVYLVNPNSYVTLLSSEIYSNVYGVTFGLSSSGLLEGNLIRNNSNRGIWILDKATPVIRNGNEIRANQYGILVQPGTVNVANHAVPVVTGNKIHSNTSYNYHASNYAQPSTVMLNATGNWWGTTDPSVIAAKIFDYADGPGGSPTLDVRGFVDAEGDVVPGEQLLGLLAADTTLTANTEYWVLSDLIVAQGKTLTAPAGVTFRHATGAELVVWGTLNLTGTAANPVLLTSTASTPVAGGWSGVVVSGTGAQVNLNHVEISGATTGLRVTSNGRAALSSGNVHDNDSGIWFDTAGQGTVSGSQIYSNTQYGVYLINANSYVTMTGSEIYSNNVGVYFHDAAGGLLEGNLIRNSVAHGVFVQSRSAPVIRNGNEIRSNKYGITVVPTSATLASNPNPVITGNKIHSNSSMNYQAYTFAQPSTVKLNATGNWWGTTDPSAIAAKIYDYVESSDNAPVVDVRGFVDSEGDVVPGEQLLGLLTADTTLTANTEYLVLSDLIVAQGKTLTVPEGVTFRHATGAELVVWGTLNVTGTAANPVLLTSTVDTPVAGSWSGVVVSGTGAQVNLSHVEISGAKTGLQVINNARATLSNGNVHHNADGIRITSAGQGTVSSSQIYSNTQYGVYLINANSYVTLTGGEIYSNDVGVYFSDAAGGLLEGNLIRNNVTYGVYVQNKSAPVIRNGNEVRSNSIGIYVGPSSVALANNSAPVTTGNRIHSNTNWNYQAQSFAQPSTVKLNATGNWWGTTDPSAIAAKIHDYADNSTSSPPVDIRGFVDAAGAVVPGEQLLGLLTADTTLTANTEYLVLSDLIVTQGKTLTVPEGVTFRHATGAELVVWGTLNVTGTAANPVLLTSTVDTPVAGGWSGVVVSGTGAQVNLSHVEISGATTGLQVVNNARATLSNGSVHHNTDGIRINLAGQGTVSSSQIYSNTSGVSLVNVSSYVTLTGSEIYSNSVGVSFNDAAGGLLENNLIRNNVSNGIEVLSKSAPVIRNGNEVRNNAIGIYVGPSSVALANNPAPVTTGNKIYSNTTWNYQAQSFAQPSTVKLNATGNWWGTADPSAIAAKIHDYVESQSSSPVVDFSGFLDDAGQPVVTGEPLFGYLTNDRTLIANSTYLVINNLYVSAGKTLTIPQGVVLKFVNGSMLEVSGSLNVSGTATAPVVFSSAEESPIRGSWKGISVISGGGAQTISLNHARIEWADVGIKTTAINLFLSNTEIRNFQSTGILMTNAGGLLDRVHVDNGDRASSVVMHRGIYLIGSSPTIQNSIIQNTYYGVVLSGNSNPVIQNNVIAFNSYGIYLIGSGVDSGNPRPTITGNDLLSPGPGNSVVYFSNYGSNSALSINLTGNWWGSTTPNFNNLVYFSSSKSSVANTSNYLQAPSQSPVASVLVLANSYFSPNADGVKDAVSATAGLTGSANWTLSVQNASGAVVRSYSGTGASVSVSWDGRDQAGVTQSDGLYKLVLTTTLDNRTKGWQQVMLDNTQPAAIVTSPVAGTTIENDLSVAVNGSATDANLQDYSVQWGSGESPVTFQNLASGTSNVRNVTLASWVINNQNGGAAPASGAYTLKLLVTDKAGNSRQALVPVTLDTLNIFNVSKSVTQIDLSNNGAVTVNYSVGGAANVIAKIYADGATTPVYQQTQAHSAGGAYSVTWNGRDESNGLVPEGVYRIELEAMQGSKRILYAPVHTPVNVTGSGAVDTAFNTHKNDFWQTTYTLAQPARLDLSIGLAGTATTFYAFKGKAFDAGTHPIVWDGRDPNGAVVSGMVNATFSMPKSLAPNEIIVKGTNLTLSSAHPTRLEILSDPNMVVHSYEQFSQIRYRIDQDAYVSFTLLPPGVNDPNDASAFHLLENQLQSGSAAAQPAVEWKGYDEDDTNNILINTEGTYTYLIEARSVATGYVSRYRGSLQLYQ